MFICPKKTRIDFEWLMGINDYELHFILVRTLTGKERSTHVQNLVVIILYAHLWQHSIYTVYKAI